MEYESDTRTVYDVVDIETMTHHSHSEAHSSTPGHVPNADAVPSDYIAWLGIQCEVQLIIS